MVRDSGVARGGLGGRTAHPRKILGEIFRGKEKIVGRKERREGRRKKRKGEKVGKERKNGKRGKEERGRREKKKGEKEMFNLNMQAYFVNLVT